MGELVFVDAWREEQMYLALKYVRDSRGLSIGARGLALTIADAYNEQEGYAWPTQEQLAEEFGVTERAIRKWIAELQKQGVIVVKKAPKGRNNVYYMPAVEDLIEERNREASRNAN